ncbi:hypothetical protein [Butyrivibrio sp. WCD2001]|uniref:hypothetical protein n=1 Tax=Butyrivibrio sp. WCD2001 TaxID=1280681 RepID=UPI000421FF88|nr:hypothetical protein [Butyrivibrio sp. WCD2001]
MRFVKSEDKSTTGKMPIGFMRGSFVRAGDKSKREEIVGRIYAWKLIKEKR